MFSPEFDKQHKAVRRDRLLLPDYLESRMLQLLPESSLDIR
ncbi:hypothetical protein [Laspinema palackyanum]